MRAKDVCFALAVILISVAAANSQALEICSRASGVPSFGEAWGPVPFIFGKVILSGFDPDAKLPKVTVAYTERGRPEIRVIIDKSGNYCFRRTNAEIAATVVIYLESTEVARRAIESLGPAQQREDFEVAADPSNRTVPPGTISAKYNYPPNAKTTDLYRKALDAEKTKDQELLVRLLKEIVRVDPSDFIAWARLGSTYFERKANAESEDAFSQSLKLRPDYQPAMVSLAKVYLVQVKTDQAITTAQKAVAIDPKYARAHQVLGNAYLQAKKGSLGVGELNIAIELDPVGMAESHLMLAVLYDRAGAKDLASREYRLFLTKIRNHPDQKKFEKYIKDNPESKEGN